MANLKPELNEVIIDGVPFPVSGDIRRQKISQFPSKIVIGDTSRSDQQHVSEWVITKLEGLGIENLNEQEDLGRFWDSYGIWTLDPKCIHLMRESTSILATSTGFSPIALASVGDAEGTHLYIWKGKLYLTHGNGYVKRFEPGVDWADVVSAAGYEEITDVLQYTTSGGTVENLVMLMPGTAAWLISTSGDSGSFTMTTGAAVYKATVVDGVLVGANYIDILETTDLATWTQAIEHRINSKPVQLIPYRLTENRDEIPVASFATGLYYIDRTSGRAYRAMPYYGGDDNSGGGMIELKDELYVPCDHLLWKINSSTIDEIGPYQDEGLDLEDLRIRKVFVYQGRLFALLKTAILLYEDGWHYLVNLQGDLYTIADAVVGTVTDIATGALFWLEVGKSPTTDYTRVWYLTLPAEGVRLIKDPSTAADWTAQGQFTLPYFDGGFSEWDKVALSVEVLGRSLGTAETIEIQYRMDEETAWKSLGYARINGRTSLPFPDERGKPLGITFRKLQLRVYLTHSTANATPVLEALTLRYYRNPGELYGWRMLVDCTQPWKGKTGAELAEKLLELDASAPLTTLCFEAGVERYVKLLNLNATEATGQGPVARYELVFGEMG